MKNKLLVMLTVAVLVACGGGGGKQALADVTDEMFNALVARVTANENAIAALQPVPVDRVLDANGNEVGPVVGVGAGAMRMVSVNAGGLWFTMAFGPNGSWEPVTRYYTEPTCTTPSYFVDRNEITAGFDFAFFGEGDNATLYDLTPVSGQVIPGWKREAFSGQCASIGNPRLSFYKADRVGVATGQYTPPYHVGG